MIDSVHLLLDDVSLPDDLFGGGVVNEAFDTGVRSVRLYRNPSVGAYGPRFTFWRDESGVGTLKLEVSLPKLAAVAGNMSQEDVRYSLDLLNRQVRKAFGGVLPDVRRWRVQRIDYYYDFAVQQPGAYVGAYAMRDLPRMGKHKHRLDGVTWENASRSVKLYDKAKERGDGSAPALRFEVSLYRRAVVSVCKRWFGCAQTLADLAHFGRALHVLAVHAEKLCLHRAPTIDVQIPFHASLSFGSGSVLPALGALWLLQTYGDGVQSLGLVSDSTLSRWRRRLGDAGLLSASPAALSRLLLPVIAVVGEENLKLLSFGSRESVDKILPEILGLKVRPAQMIREAVDGWLYRRN